MAHIDGLTRLGMEINAPYLGDWPDKIGRYLLNFGTLELLSYQYLNSLEPTREDFNRNLDRLLGPRIDRIISLLQSADQISAKDKKGIEALWLEVKELAKWRNRIAHNPVLPTWKEGSNSDKDPPDLIGVPDMKQLKTSEVSDSISIKGMDKLIDASANLGKRIHEAASKLPKAQQAIPADRGEERRSR